MKRLVLIILFLYSGSLAAQEHHSTASLVTNHNTLVSGMKIAVQLDIEKDWHAYWENPGDVGAPPKLNITSNQPIDVSEMFYPIPHRIVSNPYDSYGFENETLFYKTIHFQNLTGDVELKIDAEWLICKEICVPCTKSFTLKLPITNSKSDESHFKSFNYPQVGVDVQSNLNFGNDETTLTLTSDIFKNAKTADFFPTLKMTQTFNKPTSHEINGNKVIFHYSSTNFKQSPVEGLIKLDDKTAYWIGKKDIPAETAPEPTQNLSLGLVLLFAFLGGIILNLMPCVLPVVSLKVLSILKNSHNEQKLIRKSNLWFSAGIVVSLVLFSLTFLFIKQTGQQLGWGFQLQSPTFVGLLAIFFFLIGLNLMGYFEIESIPLPGIGKIFQKNSPITDFLAGFLTTVVATPCSAPFMAAAIGFALTQNSWIVMITFASLGLGLSFPYLLLSVWPKLGKFFPRPGAWMVILKEFLAFPMFLTVIWLVWLLSQLTGSIAIVYILSSLCLIVFFFWARQKLFNKNAMAKNILLLLIAGGVMILALKVMKDKPVEGIAWEEFDMDRIENAAQSSVVFVDFTADWCITCKANERLTFGNAEVIQTIESKKIRMFKADWTRQNPKITEVLQRYGRAGVPFYLLYKPGLTSPVVLPTLLTPSIFMDSIN